MKFFDNPEGVLKDLLIALVLALLFFTAVASLCHCARVPVAIASQGPGQPPAVAYMTTLGGSVTVTPAETSNGWAIQTDHTQSFADINKTAQRGLTVWGIDRVAGKTFNWLGNRNQIQSTEALDTLRETNRHTEAVNASQQAFALDSALLTPTP